MKIRNKKNAGFSFIEVLISIFLISIGLLSVVSLISSRLVEVISSRNQSIAGLLAEEGTELIINFRDNKSVAALESFDGFPASEGCNCIIDAQLASEPNLVCSASAEGKKLDYFTDSVRGYYHSGTFSSLEDREKTHFQRQICLDYVDGSGPGDSTTVKITSVVVWGGSFPLGFPATGNCSSANKCAYTETVLTNWKD